MKCHGGRVGCAPELCKQIQAAGSIATVLSIFLVSSAASDPRKAAF
jgi:hypothetical protein